MNHTILVDIEEAPAARKAIAKLVRKAKRYGCDDIVVAERPVEKRERIPLSADGKDYSYYAPRACIAFDVSGSAPRVGDFEFLARIERTAAGCLVDTVPGTQADPSWRSADGSCSHCHTKRDRKLIFAVRESGGRVQLVGRSCLRDYLGCDTPQKILARFSLFRELAAFECGSARGRSEPTLTVLTYAALAIRLRGWVSKAKAADIEKRYGRLQTPTSGVVSFLLVPPHPGAGHEVHKEWREMHDSLTAADIETAKETLAWGQSLAPSSDYAHNLRTILSLGFVESKRLGLVVSAVGSYLREMNRLEKRPPQRGTAPSGRQTVAVRIRSWRAEETEFGLTYKALYESSEGWRAWGTIPRAVLGSLDRENELTDMRLTIRGTFTPKANDPSFAIVRRPSLEKIS